MDSVKLVFVVNHEDAIHLIASLVPVHMLMLINCNYLIQHVISLMLESIQIDKASPFLHLT